MKTDIHPLSSLSAGRLLVWTLVVSAVAVAQPPAGKLITYSINQESGKNSVQYIVIDLAKLAGLGYDWDKSFAQTDPECRRFVTKVSIVDQPFSGDGQDPRPCQPSLRSRKRQSALPCATQPGKGDQLFH